ncbi:MAG TPA: hypothetical protein VIL20_29630 [Sandaracinaceae bacterium]
MVPSFEHERAPGKPPLAAGRRTAYQGCVRAVAIAALVLSGCVPDLSPWKVVAARADGGLRHDGGGGQPNPLDLGPPCPSPHLAIGTIGLSGHTARLLRIDPGTHARCRTSELVETQRSFGNAIVDLEWHPETGALLGLEDAVLGLDAEGFPRWRYEPFSHAWFGGEWLAVIGSGPALRIVVAWGEYYSNLDAMMLLDGSGHPTSGEIDPPFAGAMIAAHPDGRGELLLPSRGAPNIDVYQVGDDATSLSDGSARPLWEGEVPDLPRTYGSRTHLATDLATQRLVITHERGIAFWTVGSPPPSSAIACPEHCETFHASAPHPSDGAYAICIASGTNHLVHVRASGCELVIDGTSLGTHRMQDVALVRAPL